MVRDGRETVEEGTGPVPPRTAMGVLIMEDAGDGVADVVGAAANPAGGADLVDREAEGDQSHQNPDVKAQHLLRQVREMFRYFVL